MSCEWCSPSVNIVKVNNRNVLEVGHAITVENLKGVAAYYNIKNFTAYDDAGKDLFVDDFPYDGNVTIVDYNKKSVSKSYVRMGESELIEKKTPSIGMKSIDKSPQKDLQVLSTKPILTDLPNKIDRRKIFG